MNQQTPTYQTTLPIDSVDLKPIVENGESPTAIILTIAFLLAVLFGSVTKARDEQSCRRSGAAPC